MNDGWLLDILRGPIDAIMAAHPGPEGPTIALAALAFAVTASTVLSLTLPLAIVAGTISATVRTIDGLFAPRPARARAAPVSSEAAPDAPIEPLLPAPQETRERPADRAPVRPPAQVRSTWGAAWLSGAAHAAVPAARAGLILVARSVALGTNLLRAGGRSACALASAFATRRAPQRRRGFFRRHWPEECRLVEHGLRRLRDRVPYGWHQGRLVRYHRARDGRRFYYSRRRHAADDRRAHVF